VDRAIQRTADATALPGRLSHPRAERDVVLAAVEGRLHGPRTFKRDVRRERDRLQKVYVAERKSWSKPQRDANRAQVKALDRVLSDPKALANSEAVFRAAADYKQVGGKIERQLIGVGALDPAQALAAKVRPYAVAHMGARHDPTLRAPEAMAARHTQAREAEAAAKDTLDKATARLKRLKAERDRAVGAQRVRRGQDAAKAPQTRGGLALTTAEAKRQGELSRLDRAMKAVRQEKRAAEARWKQARRDRVKSDPKKYATGLVDAQGHRISTQQIVEHMRAHPDHGGGPGAARPAGVRVASPRHARRAVVLCELVGQAADGRLEDPDGARRRGRARTRRTSRRSRSTLSVAVAWSTRSSRSTASRGRSGSSARTASTTRGRRRRRPRRTWWRRTGRRWCRCGSRRPGTTSGRGRGSLTVRTSARAIRRWRT
jgi:hypothetical protein